MALHSFDVDPESKNQALRTKFW